ncbi:IS66 family insertion sequence element accessory protein TnpA [Rhodocytophaga aerolata]|uniref:IS66 family insertion sequence element accessory protein TnpA n=1 Tax=Rhodocytophaga aerolata TaxID=455078 RepID=UPI003A974C08
MTQKQFCSTHQMPVHILIYWVGKYRNSQLIKPTADKAEVTKASKNNSPVVLLCRLENSSKIGAFSL